MNEAHEHLTAALTEAFRAAGASSPRVLLEKPRDPSHGDIATNAAMVHAKDLGKSPRALAEDVISRLPLDRQLIASATVAGPGFINFVLADEFLRGIAAEILDRGNAFGETSELAGTRILIEFVSANPSGPLNVVSARAAAVGDSLVRMLRARGAECHGEFYVNDAGNQVRLLGESLRARYLQRVGDEAAIPEGGYHGDYLMDLAAELPAAEANEMRALAEPLSAERFGELAVKHFVESHRRSLASYNVHFDSWFYESRLRERGGDREALRELTGCGAAYVKDGATYLATSQFGDTQDWVIVTSDGRPTYFLPDIAYHLDKYARGYHFVINILGPDHHSYAAKMKAAMRALGRDADQLEIILLQHVTLLRDGEPVKMSKRAGRIIEMNELLEEVGVDAARYFFLLRRTSTPLDFDIELAKRKSDDNPVFYVQYAHARIESIFKKAGVAYPSAGVDLTPLTLPEELDLLRRLRELGDVLRETTESRDPHGMTVWLREVATQFHKFYHECRVITEPKPLQSARLALCRATQIALAKGLSLCGVSAPREM